MASRTNRPLVLVGCGPRVGVHTAIKFAMERFNVLVLISRSEEHLRRDKAAIEEAVLPVVGTALKITTYAVDVVNTEEFEKVLDRVEQDVGVPEHVNYNAATVVPSNAFEVSDQDLVYEFQTSTIGLHTFFKWCLRMFEKLKTIEPSARPSILVANSLLPKKPLPPYFNISIAKAAQWNMLMSLSLSHAETCDMGMVLIPRLVLPNDAECNAPNVAKCAWKWYRSFEPGQRPFELQVSEGAK